jgi:hypothetical protein
MNESEQGTFAEGELSREDRSLRKINCVFGIPWLEGMSETIKMLG